MLGDRGKDRDLDEVKGSGGDTGQQGNKADRIRPTLSVDEIIFHGDSLVVPLYCSLYHSHSILNSIQFQFKGLYWREAVHVYIAKAKSETIQ